MIARVLFLILVVVSVSSMAEDSKRKIIYKYKQYQKFDFEALGVEGDLGSPGDLSVRLRTQKGFKNQLPFRKNFDGMLRKAIETIR